MENDFGKMAQATIGLFLRSTDFEQDARVDMHVKRQMSYH